MRHALCALQSLRTRNTSTSCTPSTNTIVRHDHETETAGSSMSDVQSPRSRPQRGSDVFLAHEHEHEHDLSATTMTSPLSTFKKLNGQSHKSRPDTNRTPIEFPRFIQ